MSSKRQSKERATADEIGAGAPPQGVASQGAMPPGTTTPNGSSYDARRLHRTISGQEQDPPVLLLHGWGDSARGMEPVARALGPRYRIMNVDLPGHGSSLPPSKPMGLPEHAALIRTIIETEWKTQPVTIIGHSNGGRIALYMASHEDYKSLIHRLVLISPSGIEPKRGIGYHLRKALGYMLKRPFRLLPEPLRAFGLDWLRHSLVWRALASSDYRAAGDAMRATFVRLVTHHLDDRVQAIDVPTLLIWGRRDAAVSRRQMERLEAAIPDAGLVVLEEAGHHGHVDDPSTCMAATRYFLENT